MLERKMGHFDPEFLAPLAFDMGGKRRRSQRRLKFALMSATAAAIVVTTFFSYKLGVIFSPPKKDHRTAVVTPASTHPTAPKSPPASAPGPASPAPSQPVQTAKAADNLRGEAMPDPQTPRQTAAPMSALPSPAAPPKSANFHPPSAPAALASPAHADTPTPQAAPSAKSVATLGGVSPDRWVAQIGATTDESLAKAEWQKVSELMSGSMGGLSLRFEKVAAGPNSLLRIQASGFADKDAAKQFCSALLAKQHPCLTKKAN